MSRILEMQGTGYLQDKNAGNVGDYLKHFYLIRFMDALIKENPKSSIAYVESHAGAGKYVLQNSHWKNRYKYKNLVCNDKNQWKRFETLNPDIEDRKIYFGSFILAGKILAEAKKKVKMVLYEKDKVPFNRMKAAISETMPSLNIDDNKEPMESTPEIIKKRLEQLKLIFDIVICFIDPYFKNGKEDSVWCNFLTYDELPSCYILVFDVVRKPHKWHCNEEYMIKKPIKPYGIRDYGIFGNRVSRDLLKNSEGAK